MSTWTAVNDCKNPQNVQLFMQAVISEPKPPSSSCLPLAPWECSGVSIALWMLHFAWMHGICTSYNYTIGRNKQALIANQSCMQSVPTVIVLA